MNDETENMSQIQGLSKLPHFNTCCFYFSLETGAKIIGFTEAILGPFPLLFGITQNLLRMFNLDESEASYYYSFQHYAVEEIFVDLTYFFLGLVAIYLLIGIFKKKHSYVKTWVVIHGFNILLNFIIVVIVTLASFYNWHPQFFILEMFLLALQICMVLVVYSYYRDTRPGNLVNMV